MRAAVSQERSVALTIPEDWRVSSLCFDQRAHALIDKRRTRSMSMNRREIIGFGGLLTLSAVLPSSAGACRLFPGNSIDRYAAYQNGEEVGAQRFAFSRKSGRFRVNSELDFQYRDHSRRSVSIIHRAREIWYRGWLDAFSSTTRIGDREIEIEAHSVEHGILSVKSSESDISLQVSGYVVPTSLWHRDGRLVNRLMDLVDGRVKLVKVYYAGKDVLPREGGVKVASHYRIRGEFVRDTWYGDNCQLLRIQMPVENAEPVTFELLSALP